MANKRTARIKINGGPVKALIILADVCHCIMFKEEKKESSSSYIYSCFMAAYFIHKFNFEKED